MLPKAVLTLPFTVESTGMTDEAGLGGEELTPTDAAILEMIREGRYDAEIASRLFISTADVKARIERMLAQGGLRERSDFIALPEQDAEAPALDSPPSRRQPRTMSVHNAMLAVVGALAIGIGVGWVVRDEQKDRTERADDQPLARQAERPSSSEPDSFSSGDLDLLLRIMSSGSIDLTQTSRVPSAATWELGSLFTVNGTPVTVGSLSYNGNGRQIVELVGSAEIEAAGMTDWTVQRRTTGELTLTPKSATEPLSSDSKRSMR